MSKPAAGPVSMKQEMMGLAVASAGLYIRLNVNVSVVNSAFL